MRALSPVPSFVAAILFGASPGATVWTPLMIVSVIGLYTCTWRFMKALDKLYNR